MRTFSEAISISATGTTYSGVYDMSDDNETPIGQAEVGIALPTVTGTTPSLTVTPQVSIDGVNWRDASDLADVSIVFTAVTAAMAANTMVAKFVPRTSTFLRVKYVVTGTSPVFTGKLLIAAR